MAYSLSKWINSASASYYHYDKSQAALISEASKSLIDFSKCSSNLSTASNNLFPTSLYSVPAEDLSKDKASLSLSSALSSH